MREELYGPIDLEPALDTAKPPLDRLRLWLHAYLAATARVPAVVPVRVGAPVEDARTLEIYEALFVILRDAGVPVEQRVTFSGMIDAIVLGSAVDAASPGPLRRIEGHAVPELHDVAAAGDDERRALDGFELGMETVVDALARAAAVDSSRGRDRQRTSRASISASSASRSSGLRPRKTWSSVASPT